MIGLRLQRGEESILDRGLEEGRVECDHRMPDAWPRQKNYRLHQSWASKLIIPITTKAFEPLQKLKEHIRKGKPRVSSEIRRCIVTQNGKTGVTETDKGVVASL